MVVPVKPAPIPSFVELNCFRKGVYGLRVVTDPAKADIVEIKVPRLKNGLVIDMAGAGALQFAWIMKALNEAHETGRRDVIDRVRGMFAVTPAR
jgi:hypothetical protein